MECTECGKETGKKLKKACGDYRESGTCAAKRHSELRKAVYAAQKNALFEGECQDCGEHFSSGNRNKKLCGSAKEKTGCAYKRVLSGKKVVDKYELQPNYKTETTKVVLVKE